MLRTLSLALAYLVAFTSFGLSALLYYRIQSPLGLLVWPLKVLAGSLALLLVGGAVLAAALGLAQRQPLPAVVGAAGAALSALYLWRVTASQQGVATGVRPGQGAGARRILAPRPRWRRDVPFWTLRDSGRMLLCDLWQPPPGVRPSGLAVVYFHSSAWHLADKDLGTRPLFRHLAREGHVVMDVAYRLCPEVGLFDMLGDARRAIAWMKANGPGLGVRPDRIVAAGASAGGHLALLAAYTAGHPQLAPADLEGVDTSVHAVISFYGPSDMDACHRHAEALWPQGARMRRLLEGPLLRVLTAVAGALLARPVVRQVRKLGGMSDPGIVASLLGGRPREVPVLYDLASPLAHVGPHCPPTLLIQGEDDVAVPPAMARALHRRLVAAGVPAVNVVLPHTDHMFDLLLPHISLPARMARRHTDRFLALLG